MGNKTPDAAPREQWVLIRRARQLITLHGPSGPRRGSAMQDIGLVPDGALLIHNGAVVESGPSRRIENLQQAKSAREIDAAGRVVMPAFCDPDVALVSPGPGVASLSVLSRKRLTAAAAHTAAAFARAGVLSVGAHTGNAAVRRETVKTLLVHQEMQNKPLRIRSVLAPRGLKEDPEIPSGGKRRLASILELDGGEPTELRRAATAAAGAGYSLRIRAEEGLSPEGQEVALGGGAVAVLAPPPESAALARGLASIGCVHVLPAGRAGEYDMDLAGRTRAMLDDGAAVALGSGYDRRNRAAFYPQYLLHAAAIRFGMTAEEAICAATWNAACALRMSHVTGSLEPGKSADALILDASDYRELAVRAGAADVHTVLRAGQIVYRRAPVMGLD